MQQHITVKIKFKLFIFITYLTSIYCFSQVGINTENPKSMLDVNGVITLSPVNSYSSNIDFYSTNNKKIVLKIPENFSDSFSISLPKNKPKTGSFLSVDENNEVIWKTQSNVAKTITSVSFRNLNNISYPIGNVGFIDKEIEQKFDTNITNDNNLFNLTNNTFLVPEDGNYYITFGIVSNANVNPLPRPNNTEKDYNEFYYPFKLEVRKTNNSTTNEKIIEDAKIRFGVEKDLIMDNYYKLKSFVFLNEGDLIKFYITFNGNNNTNLNNGLAFPSIFTYSNTATNKAIITITKI